MSTAGFKYNDNPKVFLWKDTIDAVYHNLDNRVGSVVVHFVVDMKYAMDWLGKRKLDIKNGLLVDPILEKAIHQSYPEEDEEYLSGLVFFRAFLFDNNDVETIEHWIYELFCDAPQYVWVDGVMKGGLCFPQSPASDDNYAPLIEKLPSETLYSPKSVTLE